MTAAHTTGTFPFRHHHPATIALFVALFWMFAAILILAVQIAIEPLSSPAGAAATVAALVLTAFAYTHFVAQEAGEAHALAVGIAWLVLSISTEIAIAAWGGHPWFTLLGSPDRPFLRHVLLFVWVFSPSVFARREAAA